MASVNPLSRELVFKIVYYGPGLGGKTTTLQHLHATARPEHRGKLVSLATPVDRTLYFDFLPLRIPTVRQMSVRLQLFTVPGQVYFNATRKLVLTGADGVVFVADSQPARADANLESLENLRENLIEQGRGLAELPLVFQYNKRDLDGVLGTQELDAMLNSLGAPAIPTIARTGEGVYEALQAITERVLHAFEARVPLSDDPLVSPDFSAIEGGLAQALRAATPLELRAAADEPPSSREPAAAGPMSSPIPSSTTHVVGRPSMSFAELWPEHERALVRTIEDAITQARHAEAIDTCEALVSRVFAGAAGVIGSAEAPREPAVVAMLLGLDGRRYLSFRALVRDAHAGRPLSARAALSAFAFAIDARLALGAV